MPRGLASNIKTQLQSNRVRFADLLEIHFTQLASSFNPLRLTNCPVDIVDSTDTASSGTYAASGELLTFDTVEETPEAKVNQLNIVLSGASDTITNLFLNNDYVDKRVVIYRVFFNQQFAITGDPVMIFDGEVQDFQINEQETSSTLSVRTASVFYDFDRTNGRRTNEVSQQTIFPNDRGMQHAAVTTDDILWGKPSQ
tara:strand:- start:664 stop:1257 length:594 start_codon:yes stop_codon:yes gene_type:complete